jgi:hypothetical protein
MYEGRSGQAAVPPAPARKTGPDVPAGRAQDVRYIAYSPPNTQEIDNTIQSKRPIDRPTENIVRCCTAVKTSQNTND